MTPLLTGVFASQISGHLNTFSPTGSYDALATYTVPSGGVSQVTFAGLPTGGQYTHLQLRYIARTTVASSGLDDIIINFNNDSSSLYARHRLMGDGSSATAAGAATQTAIYLTGAAVRNSSTANAFGAGYIDILDAFSTSKFKTLRSLEGADLNGSGEIHLISGLYQSTSAINQINITAESSHTFAQYSEFALYGVKG